MHCKSLVIHALAAMVAAGSLGCDRPGGGDDKRQTRGGPKPTPNVTVVMETSKGTIKIELNAAKAPITVRNFLRYVDKKAYDGTIFHRVIPDFMIQGGGLRPDLSEKPTFGTIENESANGLKNVCGSVTMARTPSPHSASAQFFINLKDNDFLNKDQASDGWGYAVFGKVVEGMDVVGAIAGVKTHTAGAHKNVPVEPVKVVSVRRVAGP